VEKLRGGTGCKYYPDCNSCPFPKCKLDEPRYPDVAPDRFDEVIQIRKKLLTEIVNDDRHNWAITNLMRLRRQRKYQIDKRKARQELEIPIEGYGRREVERGFKQIAGSDTETMLLGAVMDFADKHPLDKHHPMPYLVAFQELFYRRPNLRFMATVGLYGFYSEKGVFLFHPKKISFDENGKLLVDWLKAPQSIARLVRSKAKGNNNKYTRCVHLDEGGADGDFSYGFWAITKEPPLSHKP
jgi:hypothetical protein